MNPKIKFILPAFLLLFLICFTFSCKGDDVVQDPLPSNIQTKHASMAFDCDDNNYPCNDTERAIQEKIPPVLPCNITGNCEDLFFYQGPITWVVKSNVEQVIVNVYDEQDQFYYIEGASFTTQFTEVPELESSFNSFAMDLIEIPLNQELKMNLIFIENNEQIENVIYQIIVQEEEE